MTFSESPQIVIIGAGGHARVIYTILKTSHQYNIQGFLDKRQESIGEVIGEHEVIGCYRDFSEIRNRGVCNAAIGIGDNAIRNRIANSLLACGFQLPVLTHHSAKIDYDTSIGAGTIIALGATIGCLAKVGPYSIINTGTTIDHECIIGRSVHIAPGSHIAGKVEIGDGTFIGIGTSIADNIKIGKGVVVGAGSVVLDPIPDHTLAVGSPARIVRQLENKV